MDFAFDARTEELRGQHVIRRVLDEAVALEAVEGAVTIGSEPPARAPLIVDQVGA